MNETQNKNTITFNELPNAVGEIISRLEKLETLILSHHNEEKNEREWMNINELIEFMPDHPAKATIYNYVTNNMIPFHKVGKKLSFLKKEIEDWMRNK